jgi:peptide chain release factor 2
MKVLKSRLYEHYKAEKDAELAKNNPEKMDIGWGSQIRSMFFSPTLW